VANWKSSRHPCTGIGSLAEPLDTGVSPNAERVGASPTTVQLRNANYVVCCTTNALTLCWKSMDVV
jgi:hypothetical protein